MKNESGGAKFTDVRLDEVVNPTLDSGTHGSQWAEHDSILHDLSNAMTASLFIVRDLVRTLEKRQEPGLGRAKGLSQALAKELSEISEQIRCTRQSARVPPMQGEVLALIEPVERCVEMVSRLHPGVVCRVDYDASAREATVAIVGGEATLKRIVENLLINACQAQLGLGQCTEINCHITATETAVSLVVEDNGPGFPRVILDAFPSPSLSTKPEGTGMGLYGCHQLVARDGGNLTLLNLSSGGAKIIISWPRSSVTSGTLNADKQVAMAISGTHARPGSDVRQPTVAVKS